MFDVTTVSLLEKGRRVMYFLMEILGFDCSNPL